MGFSYISFREIVSGNVSNDYYQNLVLDASRHCDRNFQISNESALKKCRSSFQNLLNDSIKEAQNKNYLRSLYRIGQALHVAQDLISHSNIILLEDKQRLNIIDYFLTDGKEERPNLKGFKLTYWEEKDMKNKKNKDKYSHVEFALDHPKLNSWCKERDEKNFTYFELAFKEAGVITRKFMDIYMSKLDEKQRAIIKSYNR